MSKPDKRLYRDGVRFECTGCGDCCKSRGRYGFIYVTLSERRALAKHLGLSTKEFTRKHCEKQDDGLIHLSNPQHDCQFLDGVRCTVYEARPRQCSTWPFWPENFTAKVWNTEVKKDCEGIDKGRLYSLAEIEAQFAIENQRDKELGA